MIDNNELLHKPKQIADKVTSFRFTEDTQKAIELLHNKLRSRTKSETIEKAVNHMLYNLELAQQPRDSEEVKKLMVGMEQYDFLNNLEKLPEDLRRAALVHLQMMESIDKHNKQYGTKKRAYGLY